jgi:hypothetical protein
VRSGLPPLPTDQTLDIFKSNFASASVVSAIRFTSPSEGGHCRFHRQPHVNECFFCRRYRPPCRLAVHQAYRALRRRSPSTDSCLDLRIEIDPCQIDVRGARRGQARLRRQRDGCCTQHQQFMKRHGPVSRVDNADMICRYREAVLLLETHLLGRLDQTNPIASGRSGKTRAGWP